VQEIILESESANRRPQRMDKYSGKNGTHGSNDARRKQTTYDTPDDGKHDPRPPVADPPTERGEYVHRVYAPRAVSTRARARTRRACAVTAACGSTRGRACADPARGACAFRAGRGSAGRGVPPLRAGTTTGTCTSPCSGPVEGIKNTTSRKGMFSAPLPTLDNSVP
jgi:hypothetical protein